MNKLDTTQNTTSTSGISHRYITFLLMLSFYYLAYRYPFRMNSSGTSPTYQDTPFILSMLKYVFFLIILVYYFIKGFISFSLVKFKLSHAIEFIIVLYLFIFPFIGSVLLQRVFLLETGIFFLAIIPVYIFKFKDISIEKLNRYIMFFIYLSVISELIQVVLFVSFDRLPALAYKDSIMVRFGSIWDDPNGFAFMLIFSIVFIVYKKLKVPKKCMLVLLLFIMLLLTQSFTGIGTAIGSFIITSWIVVFFVKDKNKSKIYFYPIIITLTSIALVYYVVNTEFFEQLMFLKAESISEHISIINILQRADILQLLGLAPYGLYGESGYINMLLNYGVLYVLLFLYIGILTVIRIVKQITDSNKHEDIAIYYGMLSFIIAFYIGMINLPIDTVFPLNLILVICILISYMGKSPMLHLSSKCQ